MMNREAPRLSGGLAGLCLLGLAFTVGCGRGAPPTRPDAPKVEPDKTAASPGPGAETTEGEGVSSVRRWLEKVRDLGGDETSQQASQITSMAADAIDAVGPAAVPALADALRNDREWYVREFAAFALGRQGAAAIPAVPTLLLGLKDVNFLVTEACDGSLGAIADSGSASLTAVATGLDDRDPAIRGAVAELLGAVGPSAAAVLSRLTSLATDDEDASVRSAAAAAASVIGGSR